MKTRKMYASPGWGDAVTTGFGVRSTPNAFQVVPVLVTDATDMPDFEPGDRVRSGGATTGRIATYPQQIGNGSWVVIVEWPNNVLCVMDADPEKLTKLPHEKTVTLRVTGLDHMVIQSVASYQRNWEEAGVRVERVEEDR